MYTASVSEWGHAPEYIETETPCRPRADSGNVQVKVLAAGLHRLVQSRAAGTHYSSGNLPHIPGTDGVGTTQDGRLVYFSTFKTGGSFSEVVNVPKQAVTLIPEGVDPYQVAAFANPAFSSWMALKQRTHTLPPGFSVLIMGATSASGAIAISLARALGASKIIGSARDVTSLSTLALDEIIPLQPNAQETDFSKATDVNVILDYVYGPPTEHLLRCVAFSRPVQYVHIGSLSGVLDISLPGSVLRSKNLTIRGSGPGSWSHVALGEELPKLLESFRTTEFGKLRRVPLSQVGEAWSTKGAERIVFTP
ncbi:hypothetical protein BDV97DRAFT_366495 [Delphinella strobiligena]|nr:hypothetical protein BDV97DRAFT_366495 [Delphinella strobiligena]